MIRIVTAALLMLTLAAGTMPDATAQSRAKTRILFVFDASQSMWGQISGRAKIHIAKEILTELVDSLSQVPNIDMALRIYGEQRQADCKDTRLVVHFGPGSGKRITDYLKGVTPKGITPIAYSLLQTEDDFPENAGGRNVIILITDGIEECQGDPCAVSEMLRRKGISLRPMVVGLGLTVDLVAEFDCMGKFINAESADDFRSALSSLVAEVSKRTTAQVNLLDSDGHPTETDVNVSFYDNKSGQITHNFYHTFIRKFIPDTLLIDPYTTYDITVHTIPSVSKKNVKLTPGKHNIIPFRTPQGSIDIKMEGANYYDRLQMVVRKRGEQKILHIQDYGQAQKYLTGAYDVAVMTLPVLQFDNVRVSQSTAQEIRIPGPGKLSITTVKNVIGSIYDLRNGRYVKIAEIKPYTRNQTIVMQPGKYAIVWRDAQTSTMYDTKSKEFEIKTGDYTRLRLD